jgi:malonyl-CoA/methylmalonyl-CoA synthetase
VAVCLKTQLTEETQERKRPMANHLFDLIRSTITDFNRLFMELPTGERMSYGELVDETGRYANAMASLGVKPGDRVAVQMEKSPAVIFLYLACVRLGAVFLPLNNGYTVKELDYFISDSGASLVICDPESQAGLVAIAAQYNAKLETHGRDRSGSLYDKVLRASTMFDDNARGPDDLAAILYTSGTTGRSKGAMLSHDNLASNALALVETWRFTPSDILIHALPVFHTHGLFVATNVTLIAGSSLIFLNKFDPKAVLGFMDRASVLMGVPTFYTRLLDDPGLTREATASMRLFVSGSAPLLAETHREWSARTGHAILERYGMTETNMNTSNPYDGDRIPGTVGMPLPGTEARIVDPETGSPVSQGDIGMIEVKGPNVFKGYWNMPEKTAAEFRQDGFFITGDLGQFDERGYLSIVGRGKDLIISGGLNIYPKEIEEEIDGLSGVLESAVIGLPHADFGEGVVAVIVREKGAAIDEKAVMVGLDGRLARFKLPKRIFFVDELPRNTMGKVQKNVLRDSYKAVSFS